MFSVFDIMKKGLMALLMALPLMAFGQNHQDQLDDSARIVVDRYLTMLNIEGLPADSMLVMETAITTSTNIRDTIWMRRWYAAPEKFRVEMWYEETMTFGLVSNGKDRFKRYLTADKKWEVLTKTEFYKKLQGYDFRGHLYDWRGKGAELIWNGTTTLKGHELQVVKVKCKDMYNRYYMFEPGNGLLTLIIETDETMDGKHFVSSSRIEWKMEHEFQPLHESLLPSLESFMRNEELTIFQTRYRFEAMDNEIFERD